MDWSPKNLSNVAMLKPQAIKILNNKKVFGLLVCLFFDYLEHIQMHFVWNVLLKYVYFPLSYCWKKKSSENNLTQI